MQDPSTATSQPETDAFAPVEIIEGAPGAGWLIVCDHARAELPRDYGTLGLPESELARHIAYDIGVRGVAIGIARRLGVPAILSCFSRLLIDPNRASDDPTLVMRIADGAIIPGNARAGRDEIARRIARFHDPYHDAIDAAIARAIAAGRPPAIFSVHSFTPRFKGLARPWHATILWDRDPRLPVPLIQALEREGDLVTGENVPYTGDLHGDTLFRHGTTRGLAHALIEIRQDLIADACSQAQWADRLARILTTIGPTPELNAIRDFTGREGA